MKQVLSLENCRLKTIETKLGFLRRDSFSGKDCIQLYTTYMQGKILRQEGCEEHRDLLLLHNEDDLKGTVLSSLLLSFTANRLDNLHLEQDKDRFLFTGQVSCPLSSSLHFNRGLRYFDHERTPPAVIPAFCN